MLAELLVQQVWYLVLSRIKLKSMPILLWVLSGQATTRPVNLCCGFSWKPPQAMLHSFQLV